MESILILYFFYSSSIIFFSAFIFILCFWRSLVGEWVGEIVGYPFQTLDNAFKHKNTTYMDIPSHIGSTAKFKGHRLELNNLWLHVGLAMHAGYGRLVPVGGLNMATEPNQTKPNWIIRSLILQY